MKRNKSQAEKYFDSIRKPIAPPSKIFVSKKGKEKYKKDYENEE